METRRAAYIILGLIAAIYLVINLALPRIGHGVITTYVVQPIIWGGLIFFILRLPRVQPTGKWQLRQDLPKLAVMIGGFQVFCLVIGGLFCGFGKSPYLFTPQSIFINLIFAGTALVAMELSRAYIINRFGKRHTILILAVVALLFTMLSLPLGRFMGLGEPLATVTFLGGDGIPLLAENLLACLLVFLGGPIPAIAYRGVLQAFEWFSPILPDLSWGIKALLGTIVPALGFLAVQSLSSGQLRIARRERRVRGGSSIVGWTVAGIVVLALLWFSLGLLPFYPSTVAGGSMSPALNLGDMVIASKVSPDVIREGDIIEFRQGEMMVIHRVIEIQETEGSKFFITKGDANSVADMDPVSPEQVKGRVMLNVPRLGWVTLFFRSG
ncbi:MAG TPA: signal peptidase I [Dehalococcoidia bacterium]|nr:signal peptidase I [Dehalococcoidia bacterium]